MTKASDEVASLLRATLGSTGNFASDVYLGYPGLVVANGELRNMVWGFPLTPKSKKIGLPLKPKPVNNARADKLENFVWFDSFAKRRCLIPVTKLRRALPPILTAGSKLLLTERPNVGVVDLRYLGPLPFEKPWLRNRSG